MKGEISSQVPLPVILSAVPGMSDSGEPVLTISIKAPDGSDRKMVFVFLQNSGAGDRSYERDALLHTVKSGGSLPKNKSPPGVAANRNRTENGGFKPETTTVHRTVPNTVRSSPSQDPFHRPPPPPPSQPRVAGGPVRPGGNIDSSYGFRAERSPLRSTGADPIRSSPSGDSFRQPPPPPPPPAGNPRESYGNPNYRDPSGGFGPPNRSSARTYDPFPDERVAPQYTRRIGREGTDRSGRQAGGEFVYTPPSRRQRSPPRRSEYGSRRSGGGYSGSDSIFGTIIGLIRSPDETFREARNKEVEDAVPVLLVSLVIFAFGSTFFLGLIASDASAYPYLSGLADMGTLIFVAIEMIVFGVICVALTGVLMHYVAYYEGFDEDISQSLKVAAYSSAPFIVGGIIPFVGIIIAPIWSIYLLYTGMRETFYMESDQAAVAVLVPVAVFAALFIFMIIFGGDNFSIFG